MNAPRPGVVNSSSRYARRLASVFSRPMESRRLPQVALDSSACGVVVLCVIFLSGVFGVGEKKKRRGDERREWVWCGGWGRGGLYVHLAPAGRGRRRPGPRGRALTLVLSAGRGRHPPLHALFLARAGRRWISPVVQAEWRAGGRAGRSPLAAPECTRRPPCRTGASHRRARACPGGRPALSLAHPDALTTTPLPPPRRQARIVH